MSEESTPFIPSERPCKYCGFIASRMSDEDCPDNPANRTPGLEERLRKMCCCSPDMKGWICEVCEAANEIARLTAEPGPNTMLFLTRTIDRLTADRDAAGRDYDAAVEYGDSLLAERNALHGALWNDPEPGSECAGFYASSAEDSAWERGFSSGAEAMREQIRRALNSEGADHAD